MNNLWISLSCGCGLATWRKGRGAFAAHALNRTAATFTRECSLRTVFRYVFGDIKSPFSHPSLPRLGTVGTAQ